MQWKVELDRLMRKLGSAKNLHERAQTEGEREAAARAICRLAVRILEIKETNSHEIRDYRFPDFG